MFNSGVDNVNVCRIRLISDEGTHLLLGAHLLQLWKPFRGFFLRYFVGFSHKKIFELFDRRQILTFLAQLTRHDQNPTKTTTTD